MADARPVGVFDSGVGGISVLAALRRELPRETFRYFGDTLHAPYGTKEPGEVLGLTRQALEDLRRQGRPGARLPPHTGP